MKIKNDSASLKLRRIPVLRSSPTWNEEERVVVDEKRTLYPQEIQLLVKTTIRNGRRGFVYLGDT